MLSIKEYLNDWSLDWGRPAEMLVVLPLGSWREPQAVVLTGVP